MGNISIKLNLKQLKHVEREMTKKNGKKTRCIVIPVDENNLYEGDKGTYLDITAIELKNKTGDSKDTHLLKQNIPKELYEIMSEEERKSMPILGNAIQWGRREPDTNTSDQFSDSAVDNYEEDQDDLPF
ncbi:hypothetical protein [Christiangramia sp.]|uniref:hypothetical protein n=1 Tax=Christiangramia sp. TaxID=1931228 RepID=UPI00262E852C|nr:hypothetical protein [Christiangramia sp.]